MIIIICVKCVSLESHIVKTVYIPCLNNIPLSKWHEITRTCFRIINFTECIS